MLEMVLAVVGTCVAAVVACIKCYCWREKAKSKRRVVSPKPTLVVTSRSDVKY